MSLAVVPPPPYLSHAAVYAGLAGLVATCAALRLRRRAVVAPVVAIVFAAGDASKPDVDTWLGRRVVHVTPDRIVAFPPLAGSRRDVVGVLRTALAAVCEGGGVGTNLAEKRVEFAVALNQKLPGRFVPVGAGHIEGVTGVACPQHVANLLATKTSNTTRPLLWYNNHADVNMYFGMVKSDGCTAHRKLAAAFVHTNGAAAAEKWGQLEAVGDKVWGTLVQALFSIAGSFLLTYVYITHFMK